MTLTSIRLYYITQIKYNRIIWHVNDSIVRFQLNVTLIMYITDFAVIDIEQKMRE